MKKYIFSSFLIIAFLCFVFNSCKKAEVDNDTQSAVDNGICEAEFVKVAPNANGRAVNEKGVQKMFSSMCPESYVDSADSANGFPVTMWLYYDTMPGGSGCQGDDLKYRKGKLEVIVNQQWSDSVEGNDIMEIRFHDYYVDDVKYEGKVFISKPSRFAYRTQVVEGKCSKDGGWNLEWNCDRIITKLEGEDTPEDDSDDKYQITGTANGKNRNGKLYTANITTPLIKYTNCAWIESGVLDITPEGRPTRSLDYSPGGGCDDQAKVTINGNEYTLTLK